MSPVPLDPEDEEEFEYNPPRWVCLECGFAYGLTPAELDLHKTGGPQPSPRMCGRCKTGLMSLSDW